MPRTRPRKSAAAAKPAKTPALRTRRAADDLKDSQTKHAVLVRHNRALAQQLQDLRDRLADIVNEVQQRLRGGGKAASDKRKVSPAATHMVAETELLNAIVDQAADGIVVRDTAGRLLFANAAAQRLAQRPVAATTLDEAPSIWGETFDAAGRNLPIEEWPVSKALRGETVRAVEWHRRLPDGTRRVVLNSAAPLKHATGTIFGAVSITTDITDRKRWEDALRDSEAKFATAFQTSPVGITLSTLAEGRYVDANAAFCQMVGYARAELIGHTSVALRIWPDADTRRRTFADLPASGGIRERELVFRRKSGELFPVLFSCARVDVGGEGVVLTNVTDITARKQAEEALQQSEEKFAKAFAANPAAMTLTRVSDGRVLDVNDAYLTLMGYRREEIVGHMITAIGVWPSPSDRVRYIDALRRDGQVRNWEVVLRCKTGRPCDILLSGELITVHGDQVVLSTFLDITARKQAEAALQLSEQKFAQAFASNPAAISLTRLSDGRIQDANETALTVMGYRRDEVIGRTVDELGIWKDANARATYVARLRRDRRVRNWEVQFVTKARVPLHVLLSAELITMQSDELILSIYLDISERKRAEAALRQAHATLEQRVQERTADLARQTDQLRTMSAELTIAEQRERQTLGTLLHDGLQQLLVGCRLQVNSVARAKSPHVVESGCGKIVALLDQAIAATRSLTAELSPPILRDAGLVPALQWLAAWMQDTHQLAVDVVVHDTPPALDEPTLLLVVRSVRELLFNAVKHAHVNQAQVEIRVRRSRLQITVSDAGVGFDPTKIQPIGIGGLGLPSIRQRVEYLGGSLDIASSLGQGSRFTLRVPIPS